MERLSAATLCSSINTVLEAFQKARQRLGRSSIFAGLLSLHMSYFITTILEGKKTGKEHSKAMPDQSMTSDTGLNSDDGMPWQD
jgi:hypothetical protein